MVRSGSRCLTIIVTGALLATSALAQTPTVRITGVVRDAGGVGREAATVRATNTATGTTRTASTGPDGRYTVANLVPGTYTVTASLIGFRRATRTGVQVSDETTVDLVLEPLPLQAVTVTATLREQELAEVPFSVAAPTARDLRERGAENIEAIAANVAGFSVQNLGPGQSQVAIRGASAGQIARDQPGVKEQVGAYLDDSPISLSLFTPDLDLFDVSRVEVLRGPQGTLFGAGSLAGTVRYITNQPELGVRSTFGEVGGSWIGGGNGGATVKVGGNVPLGERAAARLAVYHNQLGGYMDAVQPDLSVDEDVNTGTRTGVRAALRFEPTPRFSVTPRLVYQTVEMDGWNRIDAYNILANPFTTTRPAVRLGERELFTQIQEPFTDDFVLGDLNLRYDFGTLSLTSISSYTNRDVLVVRDAGALTSSITGGSLALPEEVYALNAPLNDATQSGVFTQEIRLAGGGTRARWLVGGFFSSNRRDYNQSLIVSGFEAASDIPTRGLRAQRDELFYSDLSYDLQQTAVFGEATVSVLDRLDLTAGLRYYSFDEERDQVFDGIFAHDNTGTQIVSVPGETSADGFAPRFIASFRASDQFTLNAQVSRGFRLGGINDPLNVPLCTPEDLVTFGGRESWKDETAWNYEIGAKTLWMGGRTSLNVSAFHMDIRDLQLNVTAGSCSSRLVFNVPKSVSQGVEVELAVAPTRNFDLSVSGTFNNSELRSTLTSTDEQGEVSVVSGIEDGNRLPSVPRVQAAAAVTFRQPLGGGSQGYVTGTYHHVGSRFTQIDDLAEGFGRVDLTGFEAEDGATIGGPLTQPTFTFDPELPAYNLVNLRFGLTRSNWDAALYINNITDERALLALDRERGTRARVGYLTNQPRTFGVTLGFNY
ncbi:MAG: putative TonB-dependent receptor [Geminicoccaceae bacterium]|nr:putative TonB-dependent receptor [Geminicoccaceae bacterium]